MDPINLPGPTMQDGCCFPCTNKKWDWIGAVTPYAENLPSPYNSVIKLVQGGDLLSPMTSGLANAALKSLLGSIPAADRMNEEVAKNQLRFAVSTVVTRAKKRDLEVAAQERVDHEKKVKVGAARAAKRAVTGSPQPPRKFTRDNFGRAHVS